MSNSNAEQETKQGKAGGLSQDDFRRLLATPRATHGAGEGGGFSGGGLKALGAAIRTARAPIPQTPSRSAASMDGGFLKPKPKKHSGKQQHKDDKSEATSKYRDRATERRQGINPDYAETEQILHTLEEAANDVAPSVLYEQSKFLGGDREHTHLVKGLDYALLKKVREEEGLSKDTEAAGSMDLDEVFEAVAEATEKGGKATGRAMETKEKPTFNSLLASNIYNVVFEESAVPHPKVNEMFLPGRTVFVFELPSIKKAKKKKDGVIEDENPFAVPTTVVRSRVEIADQTRTDAHDTENEMVMNKVMDVLESIRIGTRKATVEREAEQKAKARAAAAAAAAKAAEEDEIRPVQSDDEGEDIFADAGRDYEVDPSKRSEPPALESTSMQSEKESSSMDTTESPSLGPMLGPMRPENVDMSQYFGEDAEDEEEHMADENTATGADHSKAQDGDGDGQRPLMGPSRPDNVDLSMYYGAESEPEDADEEGDYDMFDHGSNSKTSHPDVDRDILRARERARLEELEVDEDADYLPSFGGSGHHAIAYDSEDDGDDNETGATILVDQGTHKNKRAQLGRFDFDSEESFNQYKDSIEAVPKSAFQFGVKKGDGRRTGKWDDKSKHLSKDEKLDRDWQRISRLMEKNTGGSHKHQRPIYPQEQGGLSSGHDPLEGGRWGKKKRRT
ncbi:hypothetical protein BGW42_000385 [Actinomortierella wolfii]|nr:hypothetical protein BGW42_000385 [Actinomortierella wolfii]